MRGRRWLGVSILAWFGVWAFWLVTTRNYHPSFALAVIVTTSLSVAYATVFYFNQLSLIPRLWRSKRRVWYVTCLVASMVLSTSLALALIRFSYFEFYGPDPDPNGVYKHFVIDFFGMAVHLTVADLMVSVVDRQRSY